MDDMNVKDKNYDVWENLSISNDFLFGKVMQDAELCRELLQRILPDLEIDHIEYPELQKTIKADVDAKSVRLDVYVRDDKNTVYDIEMQVVNTGELPKRTRFYQSMLDLQMLDRGQSYKKLNHRNHKKDYAHLNKHAMHLIRLYLTCLDILERGEIVTCREKEHGLLMGIRNGEFQMEDGTYRPEFFDMVREYERKLEYAREHTVLPERPDMKKIQELVMEVNRSCLR